MDIKQITESLNKIYYTDNKRIVFWYDPEKEFDEILSSITVPDILLIRQDEYGPLELKLKLEVEDPNSRYLIYAPFPEPRPEDDWLLDIKLYSKTFHADKSSLILNELKLNDISLRTYINSRKKFFASQGRIDKLKKLVGSDDNEKELDLKLLAVVAGADQSEIFSILMSVLSTFCKDGSFRLEAESKIWDDIDKFGLQDSFWEAVQNTFGYAQESPSVHDLLLRLFITEFASSLKTEVPSGIDHFIIRGTSQSHNVSVFLSQWRNNITFFNYYNIIARYVSKELIIFEKLQSHDYSELLDTVTFEEVDKCIIINLRDEIIKEDEKEFDKISDAISCRLDSYWATTKFNAKDSINFYQTTYHALKIALNLFTLRKKYDTGISYPSADEMYQAYNEELFKFDQYYRLFHESADVVELAGWDVLKELKVAVEDCYSGWFIDQISIAWDSLLQQESEPGLLDNWSVSEKKNQHQFFKSFVHRELDSSTRSRIFVIISDALRYEVADELAEEMNSKYRFKAKIDSMLGVLPSYTSLGMAALLPHKKIDYKKSDSVEILVDDKPVASLEQRSALLKEYNGVAVKVDDLMSMSRDNGRAFIKDYEVVYLYHNQIDAVGDKAVSETNAFKAVRSTIEDLGAVIRHVINNLNGSYVFVTADHGFMYLDKVPEKIDKSALDVKPSGALISKKRYIIGKDLGELPKVWHGKTSDTAGTESEMEFWLPKGVNRFHLAGGARFFHGGASLQEVVVPVIAIEHVRGKAAKKTEINKVGISLLGSNKKIVTNIHRFEFIQTEAVSERMKSRTMIISIRDENESISNEEMVTFDSSSSSIDDRKKSVNLRLKAAQFDNKKDYYLVLRESETDIEYDRISVTIDLSFTNEF